MYRPSFRKAAMTVLAGLAILAGTTLSGPAEALTLDQIKTQGKLRFGYQEDAKPFSFKDESGAPAGFTITLCNMVADEIREKLGLTDLPVEWVPVTPVTAVQAIQQGQVDLVCGAAAETLASRAQLSFSVPIFPGGIGAVLSANGARALAAALEGRPETGPIWRASPARLLSRKIFAVVKNSTTEAWLRDRIGHFQIDSTILPVESYAEGLKAVGDGSANAFFGNRSVILGTAGDALQNGSLVALARNFTSEPLAIGLPMDSDGLRLVVDTALSREISSSEFHDLYSKWFGPPDTATLQFYTFAALHE